MATSESVEWHRFDYHDKENTAPPSKLDYEPVWIVEDFYALGVTLGYFDGNCFRTYNGSDDCHVPWWAEITYPDPPADWKPGGDGDD